MKIGQVLRDARPKDDSTAEIDGYPNVYFETRFPDGPKIPFDAGINALATIKGVNGRRPAVVIRSSPHKAGSSVTPWQDRFEPDRGYVRYFGDNKFSEDGRLAHHSRGNAVLLEVLAQHTSPDREVRLVAPPLVFFETVTVGGRAKGHVRFQGFGVLVGADLVTQVEPTNRRPFSNYVFTCAVLSSAAEGEEFDWAWVNQRRSPDVDHEACRLSAPAAWRTWIDAGISALPRLRRRVATMLTSSAAAQRPSPGSPEEQVLREVYDYYAAKKQRFEGLAAVVAQRVLGAGGVDYRPGWITRAGGDGGVDFVGRIDIGDGFSSTPIVVLGQAKCEKLDAPTNGVHIARTVARLRRGWIGVYVTTSFFSPAAQVEILEDRYPIVLIHGLRIAQEVRALLVERALTDVRELLDMIDAEYERRLGSGEPEEVVYSL